MLKQKQKTMENYIVLISGYKNGYLTTELINVEGFSIEEAAIKAELKSSLDGASAIIIKF